ncbi:MAG: hypothetical protein JWP32_2916 [Schumannella sp.]|nr:hypothetical protein [Schumannella sp.]
MPKKSTTQRGYGYAHQKERRRLTPTVNAGRAYCAQPVCIHADRWIRPGTPWALGHNNNRTAWIGPVHADCNQLDGASRGGKEIAARKHGKASPSRTTHASQDW